MTDKHLHIVTYNVPWPADYGGVIDVFYKIKTLHQLGIKIYLHCFTQGRKPQQELNKYCTEVYYYTRKDNVTSLSLSKPYIVNSRNSAELIYNLQKDNYPILLEGIHCTYGLFTNQFLNRKVFVRLHNLEFEYYNNLAKNESNLLKRLYFRQESNLLKKYEKRLANKAVMFAINKLDATYYQQIFAAKNINYLPAFSPYNSIKSFVGKGTYCLYHGNLSVNENENAVIWLVENIFNNLLVPFKIAGKEPSKKLENIVKKYQHITLIKDPSDNDMQQLVCNAHINILPSFNTTGVKLKLLNALYNGRYCLLNKAGVDGSELENCCHIAESTTEFKTSINQLFQQDFTEQEIEQRKKILLPLYDNALNAKQLISSIY